MSLPLDNQSAYWDAVAAYKQFTHPLQLDWLKPYSAPTSKILDYGCGYGRIVSALLAAGYMDVVGYDTSAALVSRGLLDGLPLQHIGSSDELSVAEASVDVVVLFAVLTCIPSNGGQADVIQKLYRILRPGGVLYISDYHLQPDLSEVGRYAYLNDDASNYGVFTLPEGATFRHHQPAYLEALLADFECVQSAYIPVMTMNGHQAEGYQWMGRKP